jgi:2-dehydro-3-deoxyphosphogluconate aldolase / (4S)-4-hydroxy-2-oxoglutarate aldolase
VPVLTIDDPTRAVALGRALVAGGLRILEVTLRTPQAMAAMTAMARDIPDAIVGAGTVLTPEQGQQAIKGGAQFLVSPGISPALLQAARGFDRPLLPGAATASEAMTLAEHGYTMLKFFPAEQAGGAAYLKSLSQPLAHIKFCPTGGVSASNAKTYLSCPNVVCVGGSWVAPADAVATADWSRITALAKAASGLR